MTTKSQTEPQNSIQREQMRKEGEKAEKAAGFKADAGMHHSPNEEDHKKSEHKEKKDDSDK